MRNWKYINGAEVGNEKIQYSPEKLKSASWTTWRYIIAHPEKYDEKTVEEAKKLDKVGNSVSENSWEPMQAKKYYEEAKKSGDNKKIDEIKKAIDAEYYAAYKAYDELKQRQNDLQVNQDRPGRVPNLEKARSNYELWKIVKSTVGNSMGKDIYQHKLDPNQYMVVDWDKDTVTIIVNGAVRDVIKSTDKVAYAVSHVYKKVNSMNKTCNDTMHEWATSKPRNIGNAKVINSDREFFKQLADDAKEREDKDKQEVEKLVGNGPDPAEAQRLVNLHNYQTLKALAEENLKKHKPGDPEYERSKKLIAKYEEEIKKNSKVGNVASEYEILKQDPSKMHPLYKKAYEEAMKKLAREDEEFKKRFEKEYGVKAKNEASDDKFAYVMREFDEGKLKTPDGKVVTDPAQAKAIAYSESKKTQNGLTRARNAIKKS